jgi:hypothetical protein
LEIHNLHKTLFEFKQDINPFNCKKMKCKLVVLSAFIFGIGCTSGNQKETETVNQEKFTVGEPQTVITSDQMHELDLKLDAGIYSIKDGEEIKWFGSNLFWDVLYAIGPKDNPLESVVHTRAPYLNMPDAHSYDSPSDMGDHTWGNCIWIGNLCRNPENGHIIAFNHIEYNPREGMADERGNRSPDYFYHALTISRDGGETFEWCGYTTSPNLTYETWLEHWFPKNIPCGNMGNCNYITKDGYFYVYYTDTHESADTMVTGVAVARCKIEDVFQAAENNQVAPWKKYYNGAWNEPGMGGKFTPLNIPPKGYMHGDAAYNSYLDKYAMITLSYDRLEDDQFSGAVLISFSEDGITWSDWQDVRRDGHWHVYPTIISTGDDNEVIGKYFWIYYQYFENPGVRTGKHGWDRVLVTMD